MRPANPDVKNMTDLELLVYKGNNPMIHAEIEKRKKMIKRNKFKLVK
jgi:hypothetical protein